MARSPRRRFRCRPPHLLHRPRLSNASVCRRGRRVKCVRMGLGASYGYPYDCLLRLSNFYGLRFIAQPHGRGRFCMSSREPSHELWLSCGAGVCAGRG